MLESWGFKWTLARPRHSHCTLVPESGFTDCRAAPHFLPLAPKSSRQGNAICESRKVLEGPQKRKEARGNERTARED